ncbi:MAG: three-Cys-motif partner protein TcmP [Candidatus Heimdallarchaeota archaeon]|nr:three-Cys-motif partner protein TcmP [Candidatus Heimdallarchaeota archaeon]
MNDKELWFIDEIELLHAAQYGFHKNDNDTEFQPLSILKLIALSYLIPMYTQIIGSMKQVFPKMIYIDIMSGSGLKVIKNRDKNKKAIFIGSPFISIIKAKKKFDFMYFVEIEAEKAKLLEKRLKILSQKKDFSWIKNRYKVINDDVNNAIYEISKNLPSRFHSFIFVDPFSIEIKLSSMKHLLENTKSDIFVNLMTHEVYRKVKNAIEVNKLNEWYGSPNWPTELLTRDDIRCKYTNKLTQIPDLGNKCRSIFDLVPIYADEKIKNKTDTYYDLLYAARPTVNGNAWFKAIESIRDKLENTTSDEIYYLLNYLYFGISRLDDNFDYYE